MNESVELIVSQPPLNAAVVFASAESVDAILKSVESKVRAYVADISTKAGRDDCASVAYKVARSKTALDDLGKKHGEDLRKALGDLNAKRRTVVDRLDALRDEVRAPLDTWEGAQTAHEAELVKIIGFASFDGVEPTAAVIEQRILQMDGNPAREWGEFADRAAEAYEATGGKLDDMLVRARQREADAFELDVLRKEKEERAIAEANALAEAAAAEAIRVAAEAAVKRATEKAEAKIESDRIALEKAETDRVEALAMAESDKTAAVEAGLASERARVLAQQKADEAEAKRRAEDKEHRRTINSAVARAMMVALLAGHEDRSQEDRDEIYKAMLAVSMKLITAIVKGEVPHTRITY